MNADWTAIAAVCAEKAETLKANDSISLSWQADRAYREQQGVQHKPACWLGANYAKQPEVWIKGCDQGCEKEFLKKQGMV